MADSGRRNMTFDLTVGSPWKVLVRFSVPVFFGLLFQQVYSLVDYIIIGQFLGANALGGIGATGSMDFLVMQSCIGFCMGFGVPMANAFGAKDMKQFRKLIGNSIWLTALISAAVMAVVITFCREILVGLRTPAENIEYSYSYIVVIFWGIPCTMLYNLTANIIRAAGDSKTSVVFLTVAFVVNIGLDLLMVAVLRFGVAGAAVATVLSQLLSGILCIIHIRRKLPILHLAHDDLHFEAPIAGHLMLNGLPMAIQYAVTAVGMISMTWATNTLGADIVNVVAISNKVRRFLIVPFDMFCTTMSTYAGQNTGAQKLDRIHRGVWDGILISVPFLIFSIVVTYFFSDFLVSLFVQEPTEALLRLSRENLYYGTYGFVFLAFVNIFRSAIQGMGYSRIAIGAGASEMIARVLCAFFLVPAIGFPAVYLAPVLGWMLADVFLLPTFYICFHKLKKKIAEKPLPI